MSFAPSAAVNGARAVFPSVDATAAPNPRATFAPAHEIPAPRPAAPNPRGGPRTPEGKRRASQNALKHGLCSPRTLLPGEDPADYADLAASLRHALQPRDNYELTLLATLTRLHWQLQRLDNLRDDTLARQAAATPSPGLLLHQNIDTWLKLERLAASHQRRLDRTLRQLRDYRNDRATTANATTRAQTARHALHGLASVFGAKKQEADVDVRPPEEPPTPAPETATRSHDETCENRENELGLNPDHSAGHAIHDAPQPTGATRCAPTEEKDADAGAARPREVNRRQ
jgi:hypothetical protein